MEKDSFYTFKPFRVPKYRIKFSNARSLADIQGYEWYSPAALYLWGSFNEKNLSDLIEKYNFKIFWYQFDKPIFTGFQFKDDKSWNHLLWAAEKKDFEKIVDGILQTVQFDLDQDKLYQYALQKLQIYDPLNSDLERIVGPKTPVIEINAFAVLSNERQCAFAPRSNVAMLPGMVSYPPDKVHVRAADRLFAMSHKNSDAAFQEYKKIMLEEQDENYYNRVEELRRNKNGR